MTLISKQHQFAFVHVYKKGGTSVTAALASYAHDAQRWLMFRLLSKAKLRRLMREGRLAKHATASEVAAELGATRFRRYFTFAFERNPWDWQVSLYKYIVKDTDHHLRELVSGFDGFKEYLEWRCAEAVHLQRDFVMDEEGGAPMVEFIGRFENLHDDFRQVCKRIGVRAELPHLNNTRRKRYEDYYDDQSRRLLEEAYALDVKAFRYRFS